MAKTFKARAPQPSFEFGIEGADGVNITVHCVPNVPGAVFLDMLSQADEDDPAAMAAATKDILNTCFTEESQAEFWEFANVAAHNVDIEMLAEIAGYLSEMYAGDRPTEPSVESSPS